MSELKYKRNSDLRREIAATVGCDPSRYDDRVGLLKADLVSVAATVTDLTEAEASGWTLDSLYPAICEAVGVEYEANAGNTWKLRRNELKAIHRALDAGAPGASAAVTEGEA